MKQYFEKFKEGKIALLFKTQEGFNQFLEKLENEEPSITWGSGCKPTEFNPWEDYKDKTHLVCYGMNVYYGSSSSERESELPLVEYREEDATEREKLFGTQLEGVFKEAFDIFKNYIELSEEDAEIMEEITKTIQLVVELNTLPLRQELEKVKTELELQKEVNTDMDRMIGEKNAIIKKLELEQRNLINSLKYLKEVSEKQDLLNENVEYFQTQFDK